MGGRSPPEFFTRAVVQALRRMTQGGRMDADMSRRVIGIKLRKNFEEQGWFHGMANTSRARALVAQLRRFAGQVVAYDSKSAWFKVLYDDGDSEEVPWFVSHACRRLVGVVASLQSSWDYSDQLIRRGGCR